MFQILFFSLLSVLAMIWGVFVFTSIFRTRKARRLAKERGPLWVYNECKGVIAICLYSDFEKKLKEWWTVTTVDFDQENFDIRQVALAPCRLEIVPTFTFAGDAERIRPHTGSMKEADALKAVLVKRVTGLKVDQLPQGFVSLLLVKDSRLVVPFCKMGDKEEALRQLNIHGNHNIGFAAAALLPK
jgi:hypothetical protein